MNDQLMVFEGIPGNFGLSTEELVKQPSTGSLDWVG